MARFDVIALRARLVRLGFDLAPPHDAVRDWQPEVEPCLRLAVLQGRQPRGVVEVVRSPAGYRVAEALQLSREAKFRVMDVVGDYFNAAG